MIDWRRQIDGREPLGWDARRDGCAFPDDDHQAYLLPFFDVGERPIDPYGRTDFGPADLRRLREHLLWNRGGFEARPDVWTITESGGGRSTVRRLEREKVLGLIDRTLAMIDAALDGGQTIAFLGD